MKANRAEHIEAGLTVAFYGLPRLSGLVLWICGTLNLLFRYGSHGEKESYEFHRLYREKNNYVVSHQVFLANHLMFFSHRWREHAIKSTDKATAHKYSAYFRLNPLQHSISM